MRKSMTITLAAAAASLAAAPAAWAVTTPTAPAQQVEQAPVSSVEADPAPEVPVAPPPAAVSEDPTPAAVDQEMDHGAAKGFGSSPGATDGFSTSPLSGDGLTAPVPLPPIPPDPKPDEAPEPLSASWQGKSFGTGGPATDGECAVRAASANALASVQDVAIEAGADDGTIQGLGEAYQDVLSDGAERGCVFWQSDEDAE